MYPKNAHILLIDSDPASQQDLTDPLIKNDYHVSHARSAREGMEKIYQSSPDVILLARKLPDMDGLLFCAELKNDLVLRHIPLILIDFEPLLEGELAARESGADDYLHKPVSIRELDGRIRQILRQGTMGFNCHPVTGLPGYDAVYRKVQETLEKGRPFAICFLDIHKFRHFNQRYGYARGDELLRKISRGVVEVLQAGNRYLDFFGHLGADDFVLVTDPNRAEGLCSKIVERFEQSVPDFYEPSDLEKGYILTRSRNGRETSHKRIFLSIAIITHEAGRPGHVARIVEQGSELLALAKKEQKSLWVKERRRSLTSLPSITREAERPGPERRSLETGLLLEAGHPGPVRTLQALSGDRPGAVPSDPLPADRAHGYGLYLRLRSPRSGAPGDLLREPRDPVQPGPEAGHGTGPGSDLLEKAPEGGGTHPGLRRRSSST